MVNEEFAARVTSRHFEDAGEVASMIAEGDADFTQVSAGRFVGSTTRIVLPRFTLHATRTMPETIHRGALHKDFVGFVLPLQWEGEMIWNGRTIQGPELILMRGGEDFARRAANPAGYAFGWRSADFAAMVSDLTGAPWDERALPSFVGGQSRRAGIDMLTKALNGVARLGRGPTTGHQSKRATDAVVGALLDLLTEDEPFPLPDGAQKIRIISRAEDYFDSAFPDNVSLAGMCAAAGVSVRTLQYAFRDLYDLTPLQYMKFRRLGFARRNLRTALLPGGMVKRAALDAGFTYGQLGRFSAEYRNLFGEYPSETLL